VGNGLVAFLCGLLNAAAEIVRGGLSLRGEDAVAELPRVGLEGIEADVLAMVEFWATKGRTGGGGSTDSADVVCEVEEVFVESCDGLRSNAGRAIDSDGEPGRFSWPGMTLGSNVAVGIVVPEVVLEGLVRGGEVEMERSGVLRAGNGVRGLACCLLATGDI